MWSAILVVVLACGDDADPHDAATSFDARVADAGRRDAGSTDARVLDVGFIDDAGERDSGGSDASTEDASPPLDAAIPDSAVPLFDAAIPDTGISGGDAGFDAEVPCDDDCDCAAWFVCGRRTRRCEGPVAGGTDPSIAPSLNSCPTCVPDCSLSNCGRGGCGTAAVTACGTCMAGLTCNVYDSGMPMADRCMLLP
jgi:hypothetical protein